MALPLAPRTTPPGRTSPPGETRSNKMGSSRAQASNVLGRVFGFVFVAIGLWGFWVSADVVRFAGFTSGFPGQHRLKAAIFLLSWMVLFGPFFYFGLVILRSSFGVEERAWLIPLRVFTYLVGLRFSAEKQRREFLNNSTAKPLPPSRQQDYIDMPPDPAGAKSGPSKTSE